MPPKQSLFIPTSDYLTTVCRAARIGKKGYTIPKSVLLPADYAYLKNELYVKPIVMGLPQEEGAFAVYRENDAKIYLPRFYGIQRYGVPPVFELQEGDDMNDVAFVKELREYQNAIVDVYMKYVGLGKDKTECADKNASADKNAKAKSGAILEVPCGRGKTVMALKIAANLQKKTIIFVHKEFLMNQWIERIAEFMPSARVGKIQANKMEIDGKDIVIAMIQTVMTRDFPPNTFEPFGLLIIDEVHRIGSEMFSKTLLKVSTPYVLGISATVERKDKLTKVLYWFIGEKIYSEERNSEDAVSVHGIYYKTADDDFNETEYDYRGQPKYSTMITKLCDYSPRSELILRVIRDLFTEYPENQLMVLAHNRSLLTYLYDAISSRSIASVGYYVGGMKERDLKETEEKQVVLATYSMAAEALDIKTLSMLLMATPKKDIEQSVGRILRVKHDKPVVVDIVDPHALFQNQWQVRKRFYKKCNYGISSVDSSQYKGFSASSWKTVFQAQTSCKLASDSEEDAEQVEEKKEMSERKSRLAAYMV